MEIHTNPLFQNKGGRTVIIGNTRHPLFGKKGGACIGGGHLSLKYARLHFCEIRDSTSCYNKYMYILTLRSEGLILLFFLRFIAAREHRTKKTERHMLSTARRPVPTCSTVCTKWRSFLAWPHSLSCSASVRLVGRSRFNCVRASTRFFPRWCRHLLLVKFWKYLTRNREFGDWGGACI